MTPPDRGQMRVLNLVEKLAAFSTYWSPRVIAEYNENQLKVVKLQGDFVWHSHADTDEVFLVIAGELQIDFRDRIVQLQTGELIVVPRGVEHRTRADEECQVLLIEPRGVVNTGETGGPLTAENDRWVD